MSAAKKVASQIKNKGGNTMAITCDVSDYNSVKQGFEEFINVNNKLDILINNAGVTRDSLLFKMTNNDWEEVINTNLKGSFLCSREAQKYMVKQNYGKIVMISSRSSLGNRGQTNYSS